MCSQKVHCLQTIFSCKEYGHERSAAQLMLVLRAQITVSEEAPTPYALPSPQGEQEASKGEQRANIAQKATGERDDEQMANNYERVKTYLAAYPNARVRDVAEALTISVSTAN